MLSQSPPRDQSKSPAPGALATEQTIIAMADALAPFSNLDIAGFRMLVLLRAGFSAVDIAAFGHEAALREALRRAVMVRFAEPPDDTNKWEV